MIKVLIVDDHPLIAEGLQNSLSGNGSISVCGIAHSARECMALFNEYRPDVILLDIKLPDGSGTEISKAIIQTNPQQKIIALTSYNQKYYVQEMIRNGVQGYLLKNATPSEIIEAIICVSEGENYFSPEIERLLHSKCDNQIFLSKREIEVLHLIAQGLTNAEIADKLFISPFTADSHRKNLILKLGAKNTASLIHIASADGFI